MRALTAPLSLHAASSPIETIVFFFAVATLAYFHVLSAIKHSQFLAPTAPSTLRPALALLRDKEWVGVNENNWFEREGVTALEIQQLMLSMEPKVARKVCIYLRTRPIHTFHTPISFRILSFKTRSKTRPASSHTSSSPPPVNLTPTSASNLSPKSHHASLHLLRTRTSLLFPSLPVLRTTSLLLSRGQDSRMVT